MTRPLPSTRNAGDVYWKAAADGKLVLPTCVICRKPFWHPRPHCPFCASSEVEWKPASGNGIVYSFTVVRQSGDPFFRDRVPFIVAIIELAEGPRIMSNVIDCAPDEVRIGMLVTVTFDTIAPDIAVPLFVPAESRP